jgi:two-component system phosphate regulon sensor histidine kinase PhoR
MLSAFHRQLVIWNAVFLFALGIVFGINSRSLFLGAVLAVASVVVGVRHYRGFTLPIRSLTEAVRRGGERRLVNRGSEEVQQLASEIDRWSSGTQVRMKDLADARVWLESILRAMVEGVLVFDPDGRISMANDAVVGLLETPRDPRGKTCLEVFRNEVLHGSVQHVLGGAILDRVEFQTGSGRQVRVLMAPIVGDGGRTEAAVAVLHDMTDERQADSVRRDFVANVSHEFKTPLTSIRGYAETILGEASDPSQKEFAKVILRNSGYLEVLVNGLLELARMESEPSSSRETFDVYAVIHEQVALREKLAGTVRLAIESPDSPVVVHTDRARFGTALANLVDNAIRYNRSDGTVRIDARRDGPHVVVSVIDSGFGIPEKDLSRIFERFYRVDKARTRDGGGTGLGLAIARHAIESQGGTLAVRSKVGSGSTFSIRLPGARDESVEVPRGQPPGLPVRS